MAFHVSSVSFRVNQWRAKGADVGTLQEAIEKCVPTRWLVACGVNWLKIQVKVAWGEMRAKAAAFGRRAEGPTYVPFVHGPELQNFKREKNLLG